MNKFQSFLKSGIFATTLSLVLFSSAPSEGLVRLGAKKVFFSCEEEKSDFPKRLVQVYIITGTHHEHHSGMTADVYEMSSEPTQFDSPGGKEIEKFLVNRVEETKNGGEGSVIYTDTETEGKVLTLQINKDTAASVLKGHIKINSQLIPSEEKSMVCKKPVRYNDGRGRFQMRSHAQKAAQE